MARCFKWPLLTPDSSVLSLPGQVSSWLYPHWLQYIFSSSPQREFMTTFLQYWCLEDFSLVYFISIILGEHVLSKPIMLQEWLLNHWNLELLHPPLDDLCLCFIYSSTTCWVFQCHLLVNQDSPPSYSAILGITQTQSLLCMFKF